MFQSNYKNRPNAKNEANDGGTIVDSAGYLTTKQMIDNFKLAGYRLEERREQIMKGYQLETYDPDQDAELQALIYYDKLQEADHQNYLAEMALDAERKLGQVQQKEHEEYMKWLQAKKEGKINVSEGLQEPEKPKNDVEVEKK